LRNFLPLRQLAGVDNMKTAGYPIEFSHIESPAARHGLQIRLVREELLEPSSLQQKAAAVEEEGF
jgi:hypothetical protein